MKTPIYTLLFLFTFGTIIHTNAQDLSISQGKAIENQVDDVFTQMLTLAEKLDYTALHKGVNDKYNAGFILNGKYYSAYQELEKTVNPSSNGVEGQKFTIDNKKISAVNKQVVLLTATGSAEVLLAGGRTIYINFNWSFVYKKIDGQWKVIHSHQSRS
ncbi:nuclear transport factor 2 family protein [Bacteroidales bacterium]|nr:nuclear transport factor 2 family protein [Bacteroidales bacterium]